MARKSRKAARRSPLTEGEARDVKAGDRLVLLYSEDAENFTRHDTYAVVAVVDRPDGYNLPTSQYREDQGLPREQPDIEPYRWYAFPGESWQQQDMIWIPVSQTKIMVTRKLAAGESAPPFWRAFVIEGKMRRECLYFSNFSLPPAPAAQKPKRG
jgi:hypothetical protein